jgi:hypothetical protein
MYERENSRSAKKREKSRSAKNQELESVNAKEKFKAKKRARSLKKARAQLCCTDNFLINSSIMHYTE